MPEQRESLLDTEHDELLYNTQLTHRLTLYPLGIPAHFESNSPEVISFLHAGWGHFQPQFDFAPVQLSIVVRSIEHQAPLPLPVFRCRRHLMSVTADAANFAACDLKTGYACAWITQHTAADIVYLRDSFTDALLLSMLNTRYLAPIHAACVVRGDDAVLFCGDSGSGKSSLALACALGGWSLLCDDATFLVRGFDDLTVTGDPFLMRFKPEALRLFPQLDGRSVVNRINGKPTIHLPTSELPQISTVQRANARYLVFLRRGAHGEARLIRRRDDVLHLLRIPAYGDAQDLAEQDAALHRLSSVPAFDFHYSGLDEAVECLGHLFRKGG